VIYYKGYIPGFESPAPVEFHHDWIGMTRGRHVANNIAEQEAQELENGRLSDCAVRSNRYPPRLKADVEDGVMRVFFASGEETEAANARLMECLGTDNPDFLDALILKLSRLSGGPDGKLHVNTLNQTKPKTGKAN
jgi:hypothetical protein